MLRLEFPQGRRKTLGDKETWAKVKYDRQIVAIANVCRVEKIYSDDPGLESIAGRVNIPVTGVRDLPFPPEDAQKSIYDELEGGS